MAEPSSQTITIAAAAEDVAAVITDYPSYPEWAAAIKKVEVLETIPAGQDAGLAREVRYNLDVGLLSDEYVLRYEYHRENGELTRIGWDLVSSQTQKSQHGSYQLHAESPNNTRVTYTLAVELKIPMLGMLKRKAEKMVMDTALKELKKRVER